MRQAIFQWADLKYSEISNSNLSQIELQGANLEHANLKNVNLQDANLVRANLSEASLQNNNLQGVNLKQALLKGADLAGTNLQDANLTLANLAMANLVSTDLTTANLERVILTGAVYSETTRFPEGFDPIQVGMKVVETETGDCKQVLQRYRLGERNFRGITLKGTYMGKADLRGADLTKADFRDANLQGVILTGANLRSALLTGANLAGVDLSGANLSQIQFKRGSLAFAKLNRANFAGANLAETNFSGANLEQASLKGANLSNATLKNVNLSHVNLDEANLTEANLTRANLSGADLRLAILKNAVFKDAIRSQNTRWPDRFNPAKVDAKSADRSIEASAKQSSLCPAPTRPPHRNPSSGRRVGMTAERFGSGHSLQHSFFGKPAIYLPLVLLSIAILAGGGYSAYRILQYGFTVPNENKSRIASTGSSLGASDAGSSPIDIFFGSQPSDERLGPVAEHYRQGELDRAITLLKSIPENAEDYDLAQDTINLLQWESDRRTVNSARQELESQNWSAAVLSTNLIVNDYWKGQAILIADDAHYQLALEALDRTDLETAKKTADLISDEVRQKEIFSEIANRQTDNTSDLLETIVSTDSSVPNTETQNSSPEAEAAFAQLAREAFARSDWLETVETASQIETPDIVEPILPLVDEAYHQLAHEAEERGDWQAALDYANQTVTEEGKIQTAPMVQRLEAAIAGPSQ
ncbi:MAG: pentapeptide repeat-containing protein [Synechococcus sp.]